MLVNSCKKDHPLSIDPTPKTNVTVEEAKSWLKKNQPALDLGENWEHPITMTTGAGDNILKIRINETLYQKKIWVLRDILFQKDANGNIQSVGYKVFLDTAYFSNKKDANLPSGNKREFIQNSDFTGKIILYTLNNEPIKGVDYLNGRKTGDLILKDTKKSGFKITMGQQPLDIPPTCYGSSLDDHQYCDGGGGPEDQPPFDGRQFIEPGNRDTPTPQAPDYSWLFPPTNPANNPAPDNGIPIGNPGAAGGASGSANPIVIGLDDRLKYPTLAKIVDGLYIKVKNNPTLMAALKQFTHLSEQQILDNLKAGKGPLLQVAPHNSLPGGSDGQFTPSTGILKIDESIATNANYFSTTYPTATEFFLTACILHEFVHYGENVTQIFTPHSGGQDDAGFQFENTYYGGKVDFNSQTGITTFNPL